MDVSKPGAAATFSGSLLSSSHRTIKHDTGSMCLMTSILGLRKHFLNRQRIWKLNSIPRKVSALSGTQIRAAPPRQPGQLAPCQSLNNGRHRKLAAYCATDSPSTGTTSPRAATTSPHCTSRDSTCNKTK